MEGSKEAMVSKAVTTDGKAWTSVVCDSSIKFYNTFLTIRERESRIGGSNKATCSL